MISDKQKALILALIVSILVMAAKMLAYFITASNSILSDALESIVNVTAGAFALYSVSVASKPKDNNHPYGHGKIEFLSSGFEGFLVAIAGVYIVSKAIYNLINPQDLKNIDIGIYLIAATGLINFLLALYLKYEGKKLNSITINANGKHIMSDALSSLGLLLGLLLIFFTSIAWIDNIVAIGFGGFIVYTGYNLVRKSIAGVMDEADNEIIEKIIVVLNQNRKDNWIDIHNFRVIKYGSDLHIDCHITLPWYYDLKKCHDELKIIEDIILSKSSSRIEIFIHADPCVAQSCQICQVIDCPVRKQSVSQKIIWTLSNITSNKKHSLVEN
ncbi:MAG: cation transporter [Bacteroidetes bacterium]|nr:cation transporter [Bacteroidota bacterium]HET6245213.1 cation diffusion facilitator family transporter [Bacteroidia bacterium]